MISGPMVCLYLKNHYEPFHLIFRAISLYLLGSVKDATFFTHQLIKRYKSIHCESNLSCL